VRQFNVVLCGSCTLPECVPFLKREVAPNTCCLDNRYIMRLIRKRSEIMYRPLIDALLAAGLFGVSAPLSKLLLGAVHPIPLAALLYLGAGLGLTCYITWTHIFVSNASSEAGLDRGDLPWLIGAILAGGVTAPILLLYGLRATPAATASLLLNFEVVATAVIAAWLFREFIGQRTWIAVTTVTAGSILLTLDPTNGWGISSGAVLVIAACVMWGLDNNLTRHISLKDPKRIVAIKGLVAGGFFVGTSSCAGKTVPRGGAHRTRTSPWQRELRDQHRPVRARLERPGRRPHRRPVRHGTVHRCCGLPYGLSRPPHASVHLIAATLRGRCSDSLS
jgi:drug/metabolite transporter (DMT)-like permease